MLRTKRLFVAFTKYQEQKTRSLLLSSLYIVRRSFSWEDPDVNMSGKSLPKWIEPEGTGELKLYNSLTREKVRFIFRSYIFFPSVVRSDAIFGFISPGAFPF